MENRNVQITILGKSVKVEIKPGHFGPATYTIFGKESSIFLFRKENGAWRQVYGIPFKEDVYKATIEALEKIHLE